jgi:nucleoside-diphosphate-sugar epimerase
MFRQDAVAVDAIAPWLPALAERVVDSRVTRWHEAMPVPLGHAGGASLPRPAARDQSATASRRLPRLPVVLRLRRFQWTLGRGQADRRSRRLSRAHVCPHRVGGYQPDLVAMQTPHGAAMSPTITHRCNVTAGWAVSSQVRDGLAIGKVAVVRVFVAGGSGVLGRRLVPQLVAHGHQVTATTTSAGKLPLLEHLGAEGVVMDGLDAVAVGEAVASARPDVIVNQMTALSVAHAGKPNLRKAERFFAATNRLRTEGNDHLLAAAEATGVSHVVAQSHASFNGIREGGWVKTEEDPLEVVEGTRAITHLEEVVVRAGGAVLRYGGFYGPGANDDQLRFVRKRMFPLVGAGTGYISWVHLDDAASATVLAVQQQATGVFNIVDDEPAPVREWLPYLAECAGARPPRRVPAWLARLLAGEMMVGIMAEGRGFSNAKAKRELGWQLRYPSWRQGFKQELA